MEKAKQYLEAHHAKNPMPSGIGVVNLNIGKPLVYYWCREKKFGNKRLLFIINKKSSKALIVAYTTKKEQQKTIDGIILNKEYYQQFIRN
ncbi:MAG: hypothetical protein EPN86_02720 [Nanoarchaeota archaeon]|nr:MAG: hypothetical protein EPN86_02720 [Nanoarchaeota archaeon]